MLFFSSFVRRGLTRGDDEGVYFGGCNHQSPGGLRACENNLIRYLDLVRGRTVTVTVEVEIYEDDDEGNGDDSAKDAPYDSSDWGRVMSRGGG